MSSIQKKLMLGLVPVVLFFVLQALVVWFLGGRTTTEVGNTVRQNTVASSKLADLAVLAQQVRRYEKEYFVYVNNVERRNNYIKEWTGTLGKINKALTDMTDNKDGAFTADDVTEIGKWKRAAEFYGSEMNKIFDAVNLRTDEIATAAQKAAQDVASNAKKPATLEAPALVMYAPTEVNSMIGPGKDRLSGELIAGVSKLSKAKTEQTLALPDVAKAGFNQLLYGAIALALLGALIAVVVLVTLPNAIKAPIAALSASVEAISKGNVAKAAESVNVAEFSGLESGIERLRQSQKMMLERMMRKAS
jgi:methyl-accepting chemotaxis protein